MINSWLSLPDAKSRINALPSQWQNHVTQVLNSKFSKSRLKPETTKALLDALQNGTPIPPDSKRRCNASLKSIFSQAPASTQNLIKTLSNRPALCIFLYAAYGNAAEQTWINKRITNQASQKRWDVTRKKKAAQLCRKIYGGLPSHVELLKSSDSELRALAQHIRKRVKREEFCSTYNLKLALKTRSQSLSKTPEGKKLLRDCYLKIIAEKGRYINDYCLSTKFENQPFMLSDGSTIAPNTLRSEIKMAFKSVKSLFLQLIREKELPKSYKKQIHAPTANDGKIFDSYAEVHYYEVFKAYEKETNEQGFTTWTIKPHPVIYGSKRMIESGPSKGKFRGRKSDFLMGDVVYVEVLRHNLKSIYCSSPSKDATRYRRKLDGRIKIYKERNLPYLLVEPQMLNDAKQLKAHFDRVQYLINNTTDKIPNHIQVLVSNNNPAGYWFDSKLRNDTIQKVLKSKIAKDEIRDVGKFPSHNEITEAGFGGLVAWYKRSTNTDMQQVAIENNTINFNSGQSSQTNIRRPTLDEFIKVAKFHSDRLGKDQMNRKTFLSLFGRTAYECFVGRDKPIRSTEELVSHF